MEKKNPKIFPKYLILRMMDKKPTYGYEVLKTIEKISGGHWEPSYGTVYGTLERLEKKGLIEKTEKEPKDRKYFILTEKGEEKLEEIKNCMDEMQNKSKKIVLGASNVYKNLFGKEKAKELLEKIEEEIK